MIYRRFLYDDQIFFAKISGDYNPVHIDKVASRRLIFGQVVVHGIHALLWGLEVWLEKQVQLLHITSFDVRFFGAIGIEDKCSCIWSKRENQIDISIRTEGNIAVKIKLKAEPSINGNNVSLPDSFPRMEECANPTKEESSNASGAVELSLHRDSLKKIFPKVAGILPVIQVAGILATTRVVGMKCPGLNSIFSALSITFNEDDHKLRNLEYKVSKYDSRLSFLLIKINGPGMTGEIKAFYRPVPQAQESFAGISEKILPQEFKDVKGIIIGGSRGLGEITAKILAAGGAKVCITFNRGIEDARRVKKEINSGGGSVEYMHFDIMDDSTGMEAELFSRREADQLYYFATPFITGSKSRVFSDRLFNTFCSYYVTGFKNTVYAVLKARMTLKKIFYPSSVFVDSFPLNMGEYAAAKAAGETLCTFLEEAKPGLIIHKPRLPMVTTDQTAALGPKARENPVPIMIDCIRRLRDEK